MNKSLLVSFILILIFSSCNPFKENNSERSLVLSDVIRNIISGKDTTHTSLMIFRDDEFPPADNPNGIEIDTLAAFGKNYYTVLAEYPNPVYNRFAIIDTGYNVLLIDKSLNGNLLEIPLKIGSLQFIQVEENFISKGVLGLKRLSLYSIDDQGETELAFRTYTELKEPGITYTQEITQIRPQEILTKINSSDPSKSELKQDSDEFLFDTETKQYISADDIFNSFVISVVKNFKSQTDKPQIISRESLLNQLGITHPEKKTEYRLGKFFLPLSAEWNEIKNVKISSMMKKILTGTKYINYHYGAEISVVQLPENDSSENYINYHLVNVAAGNYTVRFSDKVSNGLYFYQFFEYSCQREKFLLILQTLRSTYETYKADYQDLINSFSMEC
jgi:hypothetical protein